ncbi:Gfo/Idh/MocA family protein [Xylanimonas ulmi]|uniref:Putative dehydrogenase n=1 Tax=Xylanimonas ulmi TaxID=228973 RepID=A0A4Q7M539_9MICO|nr:Gfo/Idh/MocA family oxidoreductase [Xylanibacterium ulmi]RZS62143.1 putative dehydrogenase [Xylanibacterium ulmi]
MSNPTRFAVIGAGWRAQFHLRVAAADPSRLEAVAVMALNEAEAENVRRRYGVATVTSLDELLALKPEFVIAAVSWPAMPGLLKELTARGVKVMGETPPAPDLAGLRDLWTSIEDEALVQVGEQYVLMPGHASRLAVVRSGALGAPQSVEVASTHLYHATSLMRAYLGLDMERAVVSGRSFETRMTLPLGFDGWAADPEPEAQTSTYATLDFGDGRVGVYSFMNMQWWNPLLSRRIVVRGTLGEMVDDTVVRWDGVDPITSRIEYRRTGVDMNLEGNDVVHTSFEGKVLWRNAWVGSRLSEDDLAVADHLMAVGAWARGEAAGPYSLAQACQDHALGLAIEESARTHRDVVVEGEPWA